MFQKIVSTKSNKIVQPNPGQEIQEVLRGYVNISQFTRHTSLVCGLLVLSGCGKAAPWEKAHPAKGVVTHKGKPVANADVAFFPEDKTFPETVRPRAKTDENGNFVVWTYKEGDGAPAGSYKATVVHYDVVINNNVATPKPNDLPPKYATFQATDLLVKIDPGNNEIPAFDLK